MIGKTVSHYKITRELGSGGMGVVYEAVDTKLDRTVALKFLPPESTRDPEAKARFVHEAKTISALDHPNVCVIHEIDETNDGQLFLSMARYQGETLKDRIARGPLPLDGAIEITRQVAEGLAKAHEQQIVHRDIKPANIFITSDGLVKILDFGMAKLVGQTKLTLTGSTMGTPAYMSPEQAAGGIVDHRSDLWSLGVVCYEMIAGRPPFSGEFPQSVIYAILNQEPEPLTSLNPEVTDPLARVVSTCLHKGAEDRYQQTEFLLADLGFPSGASQGTMSKGSQRAEASIKARFQNVRLVVAAALVLLITAAVIVGPRFRKQGPGLEGPPKVLAVVPYSAIGLGADSYYAEGISDAILTRLSYLDGLQVMAQHTSRQIKDSEDGILEAGRSLGLSHLLEGSVQRGSSEGGVESILVRSRLIQIEDGVILWSDSYNEPEKEIFHIQAQVAESVARELDLTLLAADRQALEAQPTANMEAYDLLLRGIHKFDNNQSGLAGLLDARQDFLKAVELDSTFVEAYTALAGMEVWLWRNWGKQDGLELSEEAVASAIALNPDNTAVKLSQAVLAYQGYRDFDTALRIHEEVKRAQPNNFTSWQQTGVILKRQGQWEEALTNLEIARKLDPLNTINLGTMAGIQFWLGRFTDGLSTMDRIESIGPFHQSSFFEYKALVQAGLDGNLDRAEATMRQAMNDLHPGAWEDGLGGMRVKLIRMFPEIYSEIYSHEGVFHGTARVVEETAMFKAELAWALGDREMERAQAETIISIIDSSEIEMKNSYYISLAMAYSFLGRRDEFLLEREKSLASIPPDQFPYLGIAALERMAEAAIRVGEIDLALDDLEQLLSVPSRAHRSIIHLDPLWLTLSDHPRFQELIANSP